MILQHDILVQAVSLRRLGFPQYEIRAVFVVGEVDGFAGFVHQVVVAIAPAGDAFANDNARFFKFPCNVPKGFVKIFFIDRAFDCCLVQCELRGAARRRRISSAGQALSVRASARTIHATTRGTPR